VQFLLASVIAFAARALFVKGREAIAAAGAGAEEISINLWRYALDALCVASSALLRRIRPRGSSVDVSLRRPSRRRTHPRAKLAPNEPPRREAGAK
jgi:hypothetical protein